MFRYNKLLNCPQIRNFIKCDISTQGKEKWHLFTSVCLERKPVVTQLLNNLETEFNKHLFQVELERSLLSNHELRHVKEKKKAILLKNADKEDIDLDGASIQTAQDFEDACNEELNKFKFSDRQTDADRSNDIKSLKRKLDKHLVLLVQQKIGNSTYFLPPQSMRNDGETLIQTAERTLSQYCGDSLKAQIYGNAPAGFYKFKYPKQLQKEGVVGAKVFIYFARHLKGDIPKANQHKWLDRTEMKKEIPEEYYKSLVKFLIDEPKVEQTV